MALNLRLTGKGPTDLRKHPAVLADLEARAKRIAAAAGEGVEATSMIGQTRARATAITVTYPAMAREARDRTLTRAIDAGR